MRFERSSRGQEPSRGHKLSILENVVLYRDFTSAMRLHFRSDLVGVALVGATPLHLLSQTALPLKSPTGAFIAALRFANAVQPQTLLRTDEEELCQFDIIPPTAAEASIRKQITERNNVSESYGKRNRLIIPPAKKNRAFPTGNALLYISLSYVDFSGCVRRGAPYFCFIMVGCTSKRIYRFFFSLAASWLVLRCSTIWANHSTIAGSS